MSTFKGFWSRWIVNDEVVENSWAYIKSTKQGLVFLPVSGWQYYNGTWQEDDTLTVTGKNISCLTWN